MNIIVTGASSGIGFELVKNLCQNTENKVVGIARNEAKLRRLSLQTSGNFYPIPFDLSAPDVAPLIQQIQSVVPSVDVLINNAGLLINHPFTQLTDANWQHIFEVNVFAVARLTRALFPLFTKPGAHVVNIGSMGGYMGSAKFPGLSAYSAAKAAVAVMSECLAEEWQPDGIKVNCLALGAVQTEMLNAAFPDYTAPLQAYEMAVWIAHFAQFGNRYFNGKVLPVSVTTP